MNMSVESAFVKFQTLATASLEDCGSWERMYKGAKDTVNANVELAYGKEEVSQRVSDHVTSGGTVSDIIGKANEAAGLHNQHATRLLNKIKGKIEELMTNRYQCISSDDPLVYITADNYAGPENVCIIDNFMFKLFEIMIRGGNITEVAAEIYPVDTTISIHHQLSTTKKMILQTTNPNIQTQIDFIKNCISQISLDQDLQMDLNIARSMHTDFIDYNNRLESWLSRLSRIMVLKTTASGWSKPSCEYIHGDI